MLRPGIREYFRLRARSPERIAEQVEEEIALHIELRTADLIARGMAADAARAEAERRFGGVARARLTLERSARGRERVMRIGEWAAGWRQDFGYSARALVREPLVASVVVVTLALGIGANATIFGIVDQLLLRGPAHVASPEQLRRVYVTQPQYDGSLATSAITGYVTSTVLRGVPDVLAGVAVYRYTPARLGRGEQSRTESVAWATADLFPLLGVQPALGRFFTEAEDRPFAAERVVVLEHGYWQAAFGGEADVLGRRVVIDDEEYTVIGVAPRGFTGPELRPARLWLPLSTGMEPTADWPETWNARWLSVLVRLRPEVPVERAEAVATAAFRAAAADSRQRGARDAESATVALLPPGYTTAGAEPPELAVSRWLAGVSLVVLLVACANVVNLLVARGLRRRRELAVRLALGVSRARLARLLLSESLLLAVGGGLLALLLAAAAGGFLRAALLPDVLWDAPLNLRVLVFSGAVVVATGVLVGLAPALQAARQDVTTMLKTGAAQGGGARGHRLRGALTVLQTAFALVLLVGASHFVRSLWNVRTLDLGIEADRVLTAWTNFAALPDGTEAEREAQLRRRASFRDEAVARLRARADVAGASLAVSTPLQGTMTTLLRVPGRDSLPSLPGGGPFVTAVADGYFETVGTRIVRGRGIEDADVRHGERVAVVNQTMAATLWPGADPLGQCLLIGGEDAACARVVGVAQDARRRALTEEPAMQYYVPLGQAGMSGGVLLVRPAGRTAAFEAELRRMLHALEPTLSHVTIDPLSRALEPQVRPWQLGATMFLVFGGVALLIAAIGLYSVIAHAVTQRRRELGVRAALGARAGTLVAMILRQGVGLVALGIAVGLPLALAGSRAIESLLFQTSPDDPAAFGTVALLLLAVAMLAAALPAYRAARSDPLDALRVD